MRYKDFKQFYHFSCVAWRSRLNLREYMRFIKNFHVSDRNIIFILNIAVEAHVIFYRYILIKWLSDYVNKNLLIIKKLFSDILLGGMIFYVFYLFDWETHKFHNVDDLMRKSYSYLTSIPFRDVDSFWIRDITWQQRRSCRICRCNTYVSRCITQHDTSARRYELQSYLLGLLQQNANYRRFAF